jgi:hypothetical protein
MIRIIVVYGIVAGFVVLIPMMWSMLTLTEDTIPENAALYGYLSMLLALTAVFLGVKHHRDKALGGVIKFLPALAIGLGISAVASLFWVVGWEITLATGFDFAGAYTNSVVEAARARGASEAEVQKVISDTAAFLDMYANPLVRAAITFVEMFPIGVVISLISASLLRNSRFLPARGSTVPGMR